MPGDDFFPDPAVAAEHLWASLDEAWQEAFRQAWDAFRTGNIAVGACAASPDGSIVHAARNRVADRSAPAGEIFGSALAHAEMNVLARLPYRAARKFVLTTTLEPCIQCSAAIRLGPVEAVRFAGADPLWDGCHDFSPLSRREAARNKAVLSGPRSDEVGLFGTLISRFGPGLNQQTDAQLRALGEGDSLDLVARLEAAGEVRALRAVTVQDAFGRLYPHLAALRERVGRLQAYGWHIGCGCARGRRARVMLTSDATAWLELAREFADDELPDLVAAVIDGLDARVLDPSVGTTRTAGGTQVRV